MFGYSRTAMRVNDRKPTSTMMRLITVASTGRLMEISDRTMSDSLLSAAVRRSLDDVLGCLARRRRGRCRWRDRHDGDRSTILELHLPVGDDHVGRRQPLHDFHFTGAAYTELDLGKRRLAIHHAVDEGVASLWPDRLLGNENGMSPSLEQHVDTCEHAGAQLVLLIGNQRSCDDRAGLLVNARLEREDLAFERFVGKRIGFDRDFLAGLELGQIRLGHTE